ncbi:MAG: hypothetical protein FWC12_12550 [Treponema sp.]|nr:hypothetical protein [Treponema sp.]
MKKITVVIIIALISIFVMGCVFDVVTYCPYCTSTNIEKVQGEDGVYKCNNPNCGKKFGAKEL